MNRYRFPAVAVMLVWMLVAGYHGAAVAAPSDPAPRLRHLAEKAQAAFEARGVVLHDESVSVYLQAVTGRLWTQAGSSLTPPTVHVLVDTALNAYAYPNGYLVLTTGMIARLDTESQLAMILAHEMVHYARQHTNQIYHQSRNAVNGIAAPTGRWTEPVPAGVSRRTLDACEYQADREGLAMLIAAGYSRSDVPAVMHKLETAAAACKHGDGAARPHMAQRASRLLDLLAKSPVDMCLRPPIATDAAAFDRSVAPALLANARLAIQQGDWHQAEDSVSRYQAAMPDDARAYYLTGEIRRQCMSGGPAAAIDGYQKALAIDPGFPPAHRALGELYFKTGQYHLAKVHFETFLTLSPADAAAGFIREYLHQCPD